MKSFLISSLVATGILLMVVSTTACVSGHNQSKQYKEVVFPAPTHSWIPEGAYVNREDLRRVNLGMSKKQVYGLIGKPHFEEGLFNVTEWNYIFKLEKTKAKPMICQFQLGFGEDMRVDRLTWKHEACKSFVELVSK